MLISALCRINTCQVLLERTGKCWFILSIIEVAEKRPLLEIQPDKELLECRCVKHFDAKVLCNTHRDVQLSLSRCKSLDPFFATLLITSFVSWLVAVAIVLVILFFFVITYEVEGIAENTMSTIAVYV